MIPSADTRDRIQQAWSELVPLLRARRKGFMYGFAFAALNRVSLLVGPASVSYVIDEVLTKHKVSGLLPLTAILFTTAVVEALSAQSYVRLLASSVDGLVADLRANLQAHLLRLPVSFYDAAHSGELVSRVMQDTGALQNMVGTNVSDGASELLYVAVSAGYLFYISPRLTEISMLFLSLAFVPSLVGSKKAKSLFLTKRRLAAKLTSSTSDLTSGIRTIKIYRAEHWQAEKFGTGSQNVALASIRAKRLSATIDGGTSLVFGITVSSVVYLGVKLVLAQKLTAGDFTAFIVVLWTIMWPLLNVVSVVTKAIDGFSGLERVLELLREQPEKSEGSRSSVPGPTCRGFVQLDRVTFSYGKGQPLVLRDISFCVTPGSITALVGSSGAGKSTVMSILAGLYTPTSGSVWIDGNELSSDSLKDYRQQVVLVQQSTFLFPGTIRENVLFAKPSATEKELMQACQVAGVDTFAESFVRGFETEIGERGVRLSGGQQQRISIARALLANPPVLLLDEATASLDLESEATIGDALLGLMRDRTTIVVAHRFLTIQDADQILVMDGGQIVERGTHESLKTGCKRYQTLYEREFRTHDSPHNRR